MRKYEFMIIFDDDKAKFDEYLKFVNSIFTKYNIKKNEEKDYGPRTLAYPIKENKTGHYYLFILEADQKNFDDLHKDFKLYDGIIRYIKLKLD